MDESDILAGYQIQDVVSVAVLQDPNVRVPLHLGVINLLSCSSSSSHSPSWQSVFIAAERKSDRDDRYEGRRSRLCLRLPSSLTQFLPLFRFHFGRNNCLEPLERAAERQAEASNASTKWLKKEGRRRRGKTRDKAPPSPSGNKTCNLICAHARHDTLTCPWPNLFEMPPV